MTLFTLYYWCNVDNTDEKLLARVTKLEAQVEGLLLVIDTMEERLEQLDSRLDYISLSDPSYS